MIFSLFFISSRLFLACVTGWTLAIFVTIWLAGELQFSPFFARLLSPINLEFVMGMGVAYLARGAENRIAVPILLSGSVLLALLLAWPYALEQRALFGLPFSLLVLGGILLERQGKLVMPRQLVLMGDASYSIYLVHNPLVSLTSRLVARLQGFASWGLGMIVGVAASVVVGVLYHWLIEKPLIRLFRQFFNRTSVAR